MSTVISFLFFSKTYTDIVDCLNQQNDIAMKAICRMNAVWPTDIMEVLLRCTTYINTISSLKFSKMQLIKSINSAFVSDLSVCLSV